MSGRASSPEAYDHQADLLLDGLSHADVLVAMSPQLPEALVSAVLRAARRRDVDLTLRVADLTGRWSFIDVQAVADIARSRLRLVALAGAVPLRLAGLVDHLAVSLWDIDRLIASGRLPVDLFLARVGDHGSPDRVSHGDMLGFSPTALEVARRVGFELAPHAQPHPGDDGVALTRADAVVHAPAADTVSTSAAPTPVLQAIARNLASLVPDGATLQIGVGSAPAAAAAQLGSKVDLGLHSGVLPLTLQPLIAHGVVTGRRKRAQPGRHVATGVTGGDPEAWGAGLLLKPLAQTHHPARLLEHENLWAINSAFEVDLRGQVNAEYLRDTRVASGAGQIDFARAAHASPAGASILALPARSSAGTSRIVGRFEHPATIGGSDVDYVVTEHGVARLRGLTADERVQALIRVAHPADRAGLTGARSPAEAAV